MSYDAIEIPFETCLDIRHKVLWPHLERDASRVPGDEDALHYGIMSDGKFVCCLSVFPGTNGGPTQIRKFATLHEYQGKGLGSKLMQQTLNKLSGDIFLDARITATRFYERHGFKQVGAPFYKRTVEHVKMEQTISPDQ